MNKKLFMIICILVCIVTICTVGFASEKAAFDTATDITVDGNRQQDQRYFKNADYFTQKNAEFLMETNQGAGDWHRVQFHVQAKDSQPIEGVSLFVNSEYKASTDKNGDISISLPDGQYTYTLTKERYQTVSGVFEVSGDSVIPTNTMEILSRFVVQVTDGVTPVDGALVTVDSQSGTTNDAGETVFWLPNNTYDYTVARESFEAEVGTVTIDGDSTLQITLTGAVRVEFVVTDEEGAPIPETTISISDYKDIVTGSDGKVGTWVKRGSYDYTIINEQYNTQSGSLVAEEGVTRVNASLVKKRYLAIITVVNKEEQALKNAKVTAAGETIYTNSEGEAQVKGLLPGSYEITVGKEGYRSYAGEFIVEHKTVRATVVLAPTKAPATPTPSPTPTPTNKPPIWPRPPVRPKPPTTGQGGTGGKGTGQTHGSSNKTMDTPLLDLITEEPAKKTPSVATQKPSLQDSNNKKNAKSDREASGQTTQESLREGANLFSIGFNIVNAQGEPMAECLTELHSTPQIGVTDEDGYIFFIGVGSGPHTLYVKEDEDTILAQKDFVITHDQVTEHEQSEGGVDYFRVSNDINAVTVDMVYEKGQLQPVGLHEGWSQFYSELPTQSKDDRDELNKDLIFWLIVGIAALALVLVVLIVARKNVYGRRRKKDYLQGGFR